MRFAFIGAIATAIAIGAIATGGGGGACPKGSAFPDGCAGAAAGTIQYPNMLSGYTARPAWNVAGVEYAVGIPSGTTLTPWRSATVANVAFNLGTGQVTCTGGAGTTVTLDAIDFSTASGVSPYIYGYSSSCTWIIKRSKFTCADNGVANILADNATITNNEFDQNGCATISAMLQGVTDTIKYNWFKHSIQHVYESGQPGNIDYQFNLIDDSVPGGPPTGQHENWQQLTCAGTDVVSNDSVKYNTNYQHTSGSGNGEGFQFYCNPSGGATVDHPILSSNTLICLAGTNMSNVINPGDVAHPGNVISGTNTNNYFDVSGCTAYKSDSDWTRWTSTGNINMSTGATITP